MMQRLRKLTSTALAAACVLAAAAPVVSANRLSISNRSIRAVIPEYVSAGGEEQINCAVTFEGSFHSNSIPKVAGSLIGHITRAARAQPCREGSLDFLAESLPWHVRYDSFSGSLPRITGVTASIVGLSWRYAPFEGVSCLYRSTTAGPAPHVFDVLEGAVTGFHPDESAQIPFNSGSPIYCPTEITYSGPGRVTLLGNTTAISIRLI
jgi:hypothetical protein